MTFLAGEDPTAARLNAELDAAVGNSAWTSYTPTWTGATTNPSLGNGAVIARWKKVGRTVYVTFRYNFGSTTTFGTGSWSFSLPVQAATVSGSGSIWHHIAFYNDFGTAIGMGSIKINSAASTFNVSGIGGNGDPFNSSFPITWTTNDELYGSFWYESAT